MLVTLFSDASVCQERKIGGWAAWLKADRGTLKGGAAFGVKVFDSTMGEAMAVVNGLSVGIANGVIQEGDTVLVQTDNDAVMGVLEGTVRRSLKKEMKRRKGRSKSEVERHVARRNHEIDLVAHAFSRIVENSSIMIRWRHVKGHRGLEDRRSAVNTFCDRTARAQMRSARRRPDPVSMAARCTMHDGDRSLKEKTG